MTGTMRAVGMTSFGGPEVLSVLQIPVPVPGDGEVRVRTEAACIHPVDLFIRSGAVGRMVPSRPYYVLGWDMAGTVDAVGPGVSQFRVGDRVMGLLDWFRALAGTQAEYVVFDAAALAPGPAGVSPVEAATIPADALTAFQALDVVGLSASDTLAVTGAGGAVGGFAVELALRRGLRVLGVASPQDEAFVNGLGAVFIARSQDPAASIRAVVPSGVDGLLDTASIAGRALGGVRDGGTVVTVAGGTGPVPDERRIRVEGMYVRSDGVDLAKLSELAEAGELTLRVARDLPFEEASVGHTILAKGGVRGRVLLVP